MVCAVWKKTRWKLFTDILPKSMGAEMPLNASHRFRIHSYIACICTVRFNPVAPHRWDTSHRDVAHFHPAGHSVESNGDIPRGAHRANT